MTTYWTNTKLTFLQKLFALECFGVVTFSVGLDRLASSITEWYAVFVILNMRMVAYESSRKQVV